MRRIRIATSTIAKINREIQNREMRKYLNEDRDGYEERKMREYCKANAILNTIGSRRPKYMAVNRGIHTIEWNRIHDTKKAIKNKMRNKIVLIYENETGILEIAKDIKQMEGNIYEIKLKLLNDKIVGRKKNTLHLPDKITIDKELYETKNLREMLIKNNVEIFEIM